MFNFTTDSFILQWRKKT